VLESAFTAENLAADGLRFVDEEDHDVEHRLGKLAFPAGATIGAAGLEQFVVEQLEADDLNLGARVAVQRPRRKRSRGRSKARITSAVTSRSPTIMPESMSSLASGLWRSELTKIGGAVRSRNPMMNSVCVPLPAPGAPLQAK